MEQAVLGIGTPRDRYNRIIGQVVAGYSNQATDLPAIGSFEVPIIEPALKLDSNFGIWYNQVVQERPYRDDGNYALWLQLTQQVRAWLGSCIGPGLGLVAKDHGVHNADEIMRQLKVHMKRRRRPIIQKACFDAWGVRLEDFLTIGEFVAALKQRLHSAIDLEANILPYHASIVMLRQLKGCLC
ncbi:hypothetical protein PENFLA_c018G03292 [Penicillium flavigenum]|uniref:Uncharacterized protein n=1 Tax=Penicillium flavigenum TaxID=254877 RepID=A0A1V6T0E0_9EURO|nr:hypothetical protein PENFLA_c018G03292 [Penicillium flavigenum]